MIFFTFSLNDGIFCIILSILENTVIDLNNVMDGLVPHKQI